MAAKTIDSTALKRRLAGAAEFTLLDVREERTFSENHLLFARTVPLSRLELRIADLVPRRTTPIVLCDDGDGLAARAADRLALLGWGDVAILDGGLPAWKKAGGELFSGVNVPSKAFGEYVEHHEQTPSIAAEELNAMLARGDKLVVLDSRPFDEYHRMSIPTGIDCPGAELALRVHDLAPDPDTTVVVNCAGRTRSIIGAQSLINAGIPNQVVALRNGTMGWELAGFENERGQTRRAGAVSSRGLAKAQAAAEAVAQRFGIRTIYIETLRAWLADPARTTVVLDVRSPEEYAEGHLPGSKSAPGGQLVQATDHYVGTLNARLVLVDDNGVRATMTASWLVQMGWSDVAVLDGGLFGTAHETGPYRAPVVGLDGLVTDDIAPVALEAILARGEAVVVDLGTSRAYREGHVPGAWFAIRSRLAAGLARVPAARHRVL
ncbi:MAG: thiosulfate sulfurtransferase, partial [Alphaproteobacteria bacterium]|nr:thiosulfate sulfurtransferase [Alphaproteobacteria bacterium]